MCETCCFEHRRLGPRPETEEELQARARRISDVLVEAVRKRQQQSEEAAMGAFNINITGVGGHGCERKAKPGEKLYGRCGRFTCPDCAAYDFVQRLRQAGMVREGEIAQGQELRAGEEPPIGAEVYTVPATVVSGGATLPEKRYWKKPQQALFTHWPGEPNQVVDDMLKNERQSGQF